MYQEGYSFVDLTAKAQLQIHYELLTRENKLSEIESEMIDCHIVDKKRDGGYVHIPTGHSICKLDEANNRINQLIEIIEKLDKTREYPWIYEN